MLKPTSLKERLYFLYLKLIRIEAKKITGFFTEFKSEKSSIIKQFLRFNYYLVQGQKKDRKFTDRLAYLSHPLPELVSEHIKSKKLILETIMESINRFDALNSYSINFLTEQQITILGRRISSVGGRIETIMTLLGDIKVEYEKKRDKVVREYPHYEEEVINVIDSDLKDIKKSKLGIDKVQFFYGGLCKILDKDNEIKRKPLIKFKKFIKSINVFMVRDHKSLKKIASRIKYLGKIEKSLPKILKKISR